MTHHLKNIFENYIKNNDFEIENILKLYFKNSENIQLNLGVIIVWPEYYSFYNNILNEIESKNNYNICFNIDLYVSENYIKNLLREIHYKKKWWDKNLELETKKRIKKNSKIKIIIVYGKDLHYNFKNLKKYLRSKYDVDKSYFHFSDPDCNNNNHLGLNCDCKIEKQHFLDETIKHINLLFNKNTYHFLNLSKFSYFKFYDYFDSYVKWLNDNNLNKNEFCIDNGGVLASYGFRDTKDLDFLCINNDIIASQLKNEKFGCENKNHKDEYLTLNYTIKSIINNPKNYFFHFGHKFLDVSILKKFKYNRTRKIGVGQKCIRNKDIQDYNLLVSFEI